VKLGTPLLVALVAACAPRHPPDSPLPQEDATLALLPHSMKGWELYTWRDPVDGERRFSLLVGTNRLKSLEEIVDPEQAVAGIAGLERLLERLQPGEQVFWGPLVSPTSERALPRLEVPDPATNEALREVLERRGLDVWGLHLSSEDD
jgi:hypothetical protein